MSKRVNSGKFSFYQEETSNLHSKTLLNQQKRHKDLTRKRETGAIPRIPRARPGCAGSLLASVWWSSLGSWGSARPSPKEGQVAISILAHHVLGGPSRLGAVDASQQVRVSPWSWRFLVE